MDSPGAAVKISALDAAISSTFPFELEPEVDADASLASVSELFRADPSLTSRLESDLAETLVFSSLLILEGSISKYGGFVAGLVRVYKSENGERSASASPYVFKTVRIGVARRARW